ncbi:hypothetical protein OG216_47585 (plasmid) [Streptomycetaceae bacterium NBC_01309]
MTTPREVPAHVHPELRTTIRYGANSTPVIVATPDGDGARHIDSVRIALDQARAAHHVACGIPAEPKRWTAVKTAYDPTPHRLRTQPDKTLRPGAGWQQWTEPDGTVRYGIASDSRPHGIDHAIGYFESSRVVSPADGGEPFGIWRGGTGAPWRRADGVPMEPTRVKDAFAHLDTAASSAITRTNLAAAGAPDT